MKEIVFRCLFVRCLSMIAHVHMCVIANDNFSPEGANGARCVMIAIYFVKYLEFQWS